MKLGPARRCVLDYLPYPPPSTVPAPAASTPQCHGWQINLRCTISPKMILHHIPVGRVFRKRHAARRFVTLERPWARVGVETAGVIRRRTGEKQMEVGEKMMIASGLVFPGVTQVPGAWMVRPGRYPRISSPVELRWGRDSCGDRGGRRTVPSGHGGTGACEAGVGMLNSTLKPVTSPPSSSHLQHTSQHLQLI